MPTVATAIVKGVPDALVGLGLASFTVVAPATKV